MKISIGRTGDGGTVHLDAKNLIYSRALIQANSGGGKSGLLRVIAEQVAAHIPTIIIDKEGEYHTLREKVDLILVGHEKGELAADVRSAGLLARKLVELGASAVIDLSGFNKAAPQHAFVKNFLDALIYLPRGLWHPTFVIIDEAHYFAPEKTMGESDALESVVSLVTLGRKRGFGSVLATTRLAKLHKNAADANNIFIGRTVLDVDQARAVKALGFKTKDTVLLRDMEQRNFYAFGPDLDVNGVARFRTIDCETTIPKPGDKKHLVPPAASSVVKDLVKKLEDLPQEAEQEAQSLAEAKRQIGTLKAEVKKIKAGQLPREQDTQRIAQLEAELEKARAKVKTEHRVVEKKVVIEKSLTRVETIADRFEKLKEDMLSLSSNCGDFMAGMRTMVREAKELNTAALKASTVDRHPEVAILQTPFRRDSVASRVLQPRSEPLAARPVNPNSDINAPMQRILDELAELEAVGITPADKTQLALFCGYKNVRSGGFSTPLGVLSGSGLVQYPRPGFVELTNSGRAKARPSSGLLSKEELHSRIKSKLSGPHQRILEEVISAYPDAIAKDQLASKLGYQNVRSGGFSTPLGRLSTLGLITYPQPGYITATELLFPPGL